MVFPKNGECAIITQIVILYGTHKHARYQESGSQFAADARRAPRRAQCHQGSRPAGIDATRGERRVGEASRKLRRPAFCAYAARNRTDTAGNADRWTTEADLGRGRDAAAARDVR